MSVEGNIFHKHSHKLDSNPEPGGLQYSNLTTAPSVQPDIYEDENNMEHTYEERSMNET